MPRLPYTAPFILSPVPPGIKKKKHIVGVLKEKISENSELQYYNTTFQTFSKCKWLIYSSIYCLFNLYIYYMVVVLLYAVVCVVFAIFNDHTTESPEYTSLLYV